MSVRSGTQGPTGWAASVAWQLPGGFALAPAWLLLFAGGIAFGRASRLLEAAARAFSAALYPRLIASALACAGCIRRFGLISLELGRLRPQSLVFALVLVLSCQALVARQ